MSACVASATTVTVVTKTVPGSLRRHPWQKGIWCIDSRAICCGDILADSSIWDPSLGLSHSAIKLSFLPFRRSSIFSLDETRAATKQEVTSCSSSRFDVPTPVRVDVTWSSTFFERTKKMDRWEREICVRRVWVPTEFVKVVLEELECFFGGKFIWSDWMD